MDTSKPHELKDQYYKNTPFPHIVIDNFWEKKMLETVENEIKNFKNWDGEKNFSGSKKKFFCGDHNKLPETTKNFINFLNSKNFLSYLEQLTGNNGLIPDPYLFGGGIHNIKKGGFLKIHTDFNWHPKLNIHRVLNVLIYLNTKWQDSWKGNLILKNPNSTIIKEIEPIFNRMVIFRTDDESFHGHPEPLNCPDTISRKSIALYYYSSTRSDQGIINSNRTNTNYE